VDEDEGGGAGDDHSPACAEERTVAFEHEDARDNPLRIDGQRRIENNDQSPDKRLRSAEVHELGRRQPQDQNDSDYDHGGPKAKDLRSVLA
jgi:hypothetical protein